MPKREPWWLNHHRPYRDMFATVAVVAFMWGVVTGASLVGRVGVHPTVAILGSAGVAFIIASAYFLGTDPPPLTDDTAPVPGTPAGDVDDV